MLQRLVWTLAVIVLLASALAAAEKRATPDDPTIVILTAFRTHPIVREIDSLNAFCGRH